MCQLPLLSHCAMSSQTEPGAVAAGLAATLGAAPEAVPDAFAALFLPFLPFLAADFFPPDVTFLAPAFLAPDCWAPDCRPPADSAPDCRPPAVPASGCCLPICCGPDGRAAAGPVPVGPPGDVVVPSCVAPA